MRPYRAANSSTRRGAFFVSAMTSTRRCRFREGWVGRVHVGTTLTTMIYRLPPILRRVRLDHPGIDLVVTNTPTRTNVDNIIQNRIDLGLVNLPVENRQLRITPLCSEVMVAIFPVGTPGVPDEVTPAYVARQNLLVEQATSAAYPLVLGWLSSGHSSAPPEPTPLGTVEALKSAVASNLGMAIVPEVAVAMHRSDFIVRSLRPPLSRMLALIEHRNKPNEPALEIVRNALLELRTAGAVEPKRRKRRRSKPTASSSFRGAH
jgi:DNA-binding transcriptional LysR family regulator